MRIFSEAQTHTHLVVESHVYEMSTCEVTTPSFCSDDRLDVKLWNFLHGCKKEMRKKNAWF